MDRVKLTRDSAASATARKDPSRALLSILTLVLSLLRIVADQHWTTFVVHAMYAPLLAQVKSRHGPMILGLYTAVVAPPVCTVVRAPHLDVVSLLDQSVVWKRRFEYLLVTIITLATRQITPVIVFAVRSHVFEYGMPNGFHPPVVPCALLPEGAVRYDLARFSGALMRLHRRQQPVAFPSHSVARVTHRRIKGRTDKLGFWMFAARGSDAWVNTGVTVSFASHPYALHSLLNKTCREDNILPDHACEDQENAMSVEARRRGFDTIQYTRHVEAWYKFWCPGMPLEVMSVHDFDNVTCSRKVNPECACDDASLFMNCA